MREVTNHSQSSQVLETIAMAYAETGDCEQAVAWQKKAIEAAQGDRARLTALTEALTLYVKGPPCAAPAE